MGAVLQVVCLIVSIVLFFLGAFEVIASKDSLLWGLGFFALAHVEWGTFASLGVRRNPPQ